ncbi:hypothetical protein B9G39_17925 [Zooshikella ganghwensis]|uniref:Uncharacterized protein n=1 Tax=Zooshikella ganghwensis TaxID=202772 RepID=A0A4P9VSZ6_9GAMM|nr:hypothetical protein B9G39_17925 [Zooshikella ganghwensis]
MTSDGERARCPVHGNGRRLSISDIGEIRRAIDIANSQARRKGIKPKDPQIALFSCMCNCFYVNVES